MNLYKVETTSETFIVPAKDIAEASIKARKALDVDNYHREDTIESAIIVAEAYEDTDIFNISRDSARIEAFDVKERLTGKKKEKKKEKIEVVVEQTEMPYRGDGSFLGQ